MKRARVKTRRLLPLALALLIGFGAVCAPAQAAAGRGPASLSSGGGQHLAGQQPPANQRHAVVSQGVKNMVKRAYQLTDIAWTPLYNIEGWKNKSGNRFYAGVRYTGLPYGQPHRSGSYVPWQTNLTEFLRQIGDPESPMYSRQAVSQVQQNPAPFFSCECSAFVSWAWGLKNRETTHTLSQYATLIGTNMNDLQVGDCLLKEGTHSMLVTDICFDGQSRISGIEISEETPPIARRRWFLAGSDTNPLTNIQTEYLNKGYVIIRCNARDSVGYTHSCAVPLPGDVCPGCGVNPFWDLELYNWYGSAAAFVCNQGIMAGTGANTFSPGMELNRAMFVTMLWRMYHSPAGTGAPPFKDIKVGAYYYEALRWAWSKGYAAGTGDGYFNPEGLCTRAQLVTFLWVAAGRPNPRNGCPFGDVPYDAYYLRAVAWAAEQGIVSGKAGNRFDPDATATRAEAAMMIWRVCQKLGLYS